MTTRLPGASAIELPPSCALRFEVERVHATGAAGVVYLARERALGRLVAVKVLHASPAPDPDALARFEQEAALAASVAHPHVVRVIDRGRDADVPWIAYEYVSGESLRAILGKGRMSWAAAVRVAVQIGSALAAAHERGIVHRDVKPENILQFADDWYKITDFGIAYWPMAAHVRTATGRLMGTLAYLSPEAARGEPAGAAADQYALALVLFELVTGIVPFASDSPMQSLAARQREPAPRLASLAPDAPPWLDAAVARMLETEPAYRFPSMATAVETLERGPRRRRRGAGALPRRAAVAALVAGAGVALVVALALRRPGPTAAPRAPSATPPALVSTPGVADARERLERHVTVWAEQQEEQLRERPGEDAVQRANRLSRLPRPVELVAGLTRLVEAARASPPSAAEWFRIDRVGRGVLRCARNVTWRSAQRGELDSPLARLETAVSRLGSDPPAHFVHLSLGAHVEWARGGAGGEASARALEPAEKLLEQLVAAARPEPEAVRAYVELVVDEATLWARSGLLEESASPARVERLRRRVSACSRLLDQWRRFDELSRAWPDATLRCHVLAGLLSAAFTVMESAGAAGPAARHAQIAADRLCELIDARSLSPVRLRTLAAQSRRSGARCDAISQPEPGSAGARR